MGCLPRGQPPALGLHLGAYSKAADAPGHQLRREAGPINLKVRRHGSRGAFLGLDATLDAVACPGGNTPAVRQAEQGCTPLAGFQAGGCINIGAAIHECSSRPFVPR